MSFRHGQGALILCWFYPRRKFTWIPFLILPFTSECNTQLYKADRHNYKRKLFYPMWILSGISTKVPRFNGPLVVCLAKIQKGLPAKVALNHFDFPIAYEELLCWRWLYFALYAKGPVLIMICDISWQLGI